jgi:hypothetical protein
MWNAGIRAPEGFPLGHVTCPTEYEPSRILTLFFQPHESDSNLGVFFLFLLPSSLFFWEGEEMMAALLSIWSAMMAGGSSNCKRVLGSGIGGGLAY